MGYKTAVQGKDQTECDEFCGLIRTSWKGKRGKENLDLGSNKKIKLLIQTST